MVHLKVYQQRWHQRLSLWQQLVSPVMTKLVSWQLSFQGNTICFSLKCALHWCYNGHDGIWNNGCDGISNHRCLNCLPNGLWICKIIVFQVPISEVIECSMNSNQRYVNIHNDDGRSEYGRGSLSGNSSVLAMELRLSCINASTLWYHFTNKINITCSSYW